MKYSDSGLRIPGWNTHVQPIRKRTKPIEHETESGIWPDELEEPKVTIFTMSGWSLALLLIGIILVAGLTVASVFMLIGPWLFSA